MGLIKEPLTVDFYFDGRQMTKEDQKRVSEFIARQRKRSKAKSSGKKNNIADPSLHK